MARREEEADAAVVDAGAHRLRRELHLHSQRGEHVGAAALRGDRAVPVLGDACAAAAATKAAVVEMLNVWEPSPPVPQVSTSRSGDTSTRAARERSACAAPAISSGVSPLIRSATRSAAICATGALPSSIESSAAADCSRERWTPSTASLMCSRSGHRLHLEEIAEQRLPVGREDRLGVELHAEHRQLAMAQAHDDAVARARGDLRARGAASGGRPPANDSARRAAAWARRGRARCRRARSPPPSRDRRPRPHHLAAESLPDALVSQADAEDGNGAFRTGEAVQPAGPAISSRQTPASFGVHGPGERTSRSGRRARISSASSASLRSTSTRAPSSPRRWTRLKVKES